MTGDATSRPIQILRLLGSRPAVPYREDDVRKAITDTLGRADIEFDTDKYGNVVAHIRSGKEHRLSIAFVAHMDHPGFELSEAEATNARARMLGRTPDVVFAGHFGLRIYQAGSSEFIRGWTSGSKDPEEGDARGRLLDIETEVPVSLPAWAVFDLEDFKMKDGVIHMRACDDLTGCAAILAMLERIRVTDVGVDVYGVFTRAEEEGLIGARILAEERRLPEDTIVVSVESSRALPGGEHGKGPVIRVGDAAATFSAEAESTLLAARQRLSQRDPPVPVQRQLMSGGVCEASAFIVRGYRATGVAFPLGHYHNGLGEDTINAEFVRVDDFLGGVELLVEAVHAAASAEEPPMYERLRMRPQVEADRLLRS
ncbi:MAG: M20/M25/M40 family metallo-hydrolase [Dehalococcoidia bacterium]|jgi:endoglucanase|nr:M20/M25/M40 family metallo-hydrolase [Dehalococcoidia bacterium]